MRSVHPTGRPITRDVTTRLELSLVAGPERTEWRSRAQRRGAQNRRSRDSACHAKRPGLGDPGHPVPRAERRGRSWTARESVIPGTGNVGETIVRPSAWGCPSSVPVGVQQLPQARCHPSSRTPAHTRRSRSAPDERSGATERPPSPSFGRAREAPSQSAGDDATLIVPDGSGSALHHHVSGSGVTPAEVRCRRDGVDGDEGTGVLVSILRRPLTTLRGRPRRVR